MKPKSKRLQSSDSEEEDESKKKLKQSHAEDDEDDGSSSDSSIGEYLKPADQLDLDSEFFQIKEPEKVPSFAAIEKSIFSGVTQLESEDSEEDFASNEKPEEAPPLPSASQENTTGKVNLQKLRKSKKNTAAEEPVYTISNLLALGEAKGTKSETVENMDASDDSEKENWEEVKNEEVKEATEAAEVAIKHGVQITVELPSLMRKKRGLDLMAAMKRRLNRIKKENQLLMHKVHLLCWLGHGNYVNETLNDIEIFALALSLLPSEQCYPPERTDLNYIEHIVRWYTKTIRLSEKLDEAQSSTLRESLKSQLSKKTAINKKCLVYIFVCMLRSLGIQCRVVFNFQTLPLRPPGSELCSLSTKPAKTSNEAKEKPKTEKAAAKTSPQVNSSNLKKTVSFAATPLDKRTAAKSKKTSLEPKRKSLEPKRKSLEPKKKVPEIRSKKETKAKPEKDKKEVAPKPKDAGEKKKQEEGKQRRSKTTESNNNRSETLSKEEDSSKSSKFKDKLKSPSNKNTKTKPAEEKPAKKSKSPATKQKTTASTSSTLNSKSASALINESKNDIYVSLKKEMQRIEEQTASKKSNIQIIQDFTEQPKVHLEKLRQENGKKKAIVKKKPAAAAAIPQVDGPADDVPTSKKKPNIKRLQTKKDGDVQGARKPSHNNNIEEGTTSSTEEVPPKKAKVAPKKPNIKKLQPQKTAAEKSSQNAKSNSVDKTTVVKASSTKAKEAPKKPNIKKLQENADAVPSTNQRSQRSKKATKYSERSEDDDDDDFLPRSPRKTTGASPAASNSKFFSPTKKLHVDVRDDIVKLLKGSIAERKHIERSKLVKGTKVESDEDSDYAPEAIPMKNGHASSDDEFHPPKKSGTKVKRRVQPLKKLKKTESEDRKALSSDCEAETNGPPKKETKTRKGNDVWLEVFLEAEERWICVDVVKGQVHCVSEIYSRASIPVAYVVAWNNDQTIKDVTRRYCPQWNTVTRKLRIDPDWWNDTLKPHLGKKTAREREEDEELMKQQLEQPLPKTISEYKDHPLYALKRHLLKFQAIYPPDSITLGFVRNEAVYARECVHTLHSREIWVKHAKVVRLGEKPYKIVKARPKYDKLSGNVTSDQPLEVFGSWQVDDYDPPTAENGIVPRNAYGNVELFKACMLPKGTVHLQLPCLNKVARKMNIDCASAVIGFDFHSGFNHPTFDGFVVCEEFSEALVAAWFVEQEEAEKRAQEKLEKRVYGNWKRLIRGLMIRERLKVKYNFGVEEAEPSTSSGAPSGAAGDGKGKKPKNLKATKAVAKKRRISSDSGE